MNKTTQMGLMLGFNIIAAFALGIGGGMLIGEELGNKTMGIVIGAVSAVIVVGILLWQFIRLADKSAKNEPKK